MKGRIAKKALAMVAALMVLGSVAVLADASFNFFLRSDEGTFYTEQVYRSNAVTAFGRAQLQRTTNAGATTLYTIYDPWGIQMSYTHSSSNSNYKIIPLQFISGYEGYLGAARLGVRTNASGSYEVWGTWSPNSL